MATWTYHDGRPRTEKKKLRQRNHHLTIIHHLEEKKNHRISEDKAKNGLNWFKIEP